MKFGIDDNEEEVGNCDDRFSAERINTLGKKILNGSLRYNYGEQPSDSENIW